MFDPRSYLRDLGFDLQQGNPTLSELKKDGVTCVKSITQTKGVTLRFFDESLMPTRCSRI
jgi:hypothetical protein